VHANGVTLLPHGLFAQVLQLIFTPPDTNVSLCIEEGDHERHVTAAIIGANMVSLRPLALSLQDFETINVVRKLVSNAFSGKYSLQSDAKMDSIIRTLKEVCQIAGVCECMNLMHNMIL
jgi:hypothetical protein